MGSSGFIQTNLGDVSPIMLSVFLYTILLYSCQLFDLYLGPIHCIFMANYIKFDTKYNINVHDCM